MLVPGAPDVQSCLLSSACTAVPWASPAVAVGARTPGAWRVRETWTDRGSREGPGQIPGGM